MGFFDTIATIIFGGVLTLTPIAIIDGYFTQLKVLRKLEEMERKMDADDGDSDDE